MTFQELVSTYAELEADKLKQEFGFVSRKAITIAVENFCWENEVSEAVFKRALFDGQNRHGVLID